MLIDLIYRTLMACCYQLAAKHIFAEWRLSKVVEGSAAKEKSGFE